jgi:hypothetical protein
MLMRKSEHEVNNERNVETASSSEVLVPVYQKTAWCHISEHQSYGVCAFHFSCGVVNVIQQNSFHLTFDTSEFPIIQHLRRAVPQIFAFYQKKCFINETGRYQGHVQKCPKTVCTSTVVVSPAPLSLIPSTSSPMKTPENTEEYPDDREPADEGDIQMEYSDSCTAQV